MMDVIMLPIDSLGTFILNGNFNKAIYFLCVSIKETDTTWDIYSDL